MACPDIPLRLINAVNYALDFPSTFAGPSHRKYNHDVKSATLIGAAVAKKMGYPEQMGARAANWHLVEDRLSDRMRKVRITSKITLKHIFDARTA